MATSALVTPTSALSSHRDRHDAASALLSCLSATHLSPPSPPSVVAVNTYTTSTNDTTTHETPPTPISSSLNNDETHCLSTLLQLKDSHPPPPPPRTRIGLDALADLASAAVSSSSPSPPPHDDDDGDSPPRHRRRMRSASNPEGMEKWDALGRHALTMRHFTSVKEEDEEPDATTTPNNTPSFVLDCEEELEPDELLRRARSRLLEDVNQYCNASGEKGVNTLPHSLAKYKEVYNKNGRIGIYTPAERAAIIAKFNSKRTRRVWNKKIRYNCRKNLADRRMRVKGRFVKRSSEEAAVAAAAAAAAATVTAPKTTTPETLVPSNDANVVSASSSTASLPTVDEDDTLKDVDMEVIDVNDKEAGFEPTEDQPYRRTRRHTIT